MEEKKSNISFFQKYLSTWVLICMGVGIIIGYLIPSVSEFLSKLEVANVNIPIAILIWFMIYPMMLKIDFSSIKQVGHMPKGLFLTWIVNWIIKPFTMFGLACLFMYAIFKGVIPSDLGKDYVAGMVLLGVAPCTAMVFVWSSLSKGNPAYTLVQVATNDLIILVAFVPLVAFLLGVGGFTIPWDTLILSIILFIVVPLILAIVTRVIITKKKEKEYLEEKIIPKFNPITTIGLLIMLILLFTMQAEIIIENPIHIILIAIPLIIQTFFIFGITFISAKLLKLPFDVSAPASFIGASNFFELAVAVAISLFPLNPGVSLATTVGVLVEVPVMLMLVRIANHFKDKFN
ncbi:MAG: ACR3 family arsenite efflux transporter [Anaeroplasma bactoclasticum]|nr:ACR3 family arsenite efflux transporter [Anaeroplasma bactoclasticum]